MAVALSPGGPMDLLRSFLRGLHWRLEQRERGQDTYEYSLMIAAVVISVLVILLTIGPRVAAVFNK